MGIRISGPDNNGVYTARGHTIGWKIGMFFGILFMIVGVLTMIAAPFSMTAVFILLFANILLFVNNRHQRKVYQKYINEYDAKLKARTEPMEQGWD